MKLKTNFLISLVLILISCGIIQSANATHISEPVLSKTETEYFIGDKVVLDGWVNYDNQSTPDVLLDFKVLGPDGAIANQQSYTSDAQGQFKFEFDTINLIPGTYQAIITSQCLEIHRPICTHKSQKISINIRDQAQKNQ